ncbi:MAG: HEPN family nuclease [Phycisphaerae bacterium]
MGYTEFPRRDLMTRTLENLDFVQKNKGERGPYEFTQLINSFLIAFIQAKSYWIAKLPEFPFPAKGWPVVKSVPQQGHEKCVPTNARELVERIRHSLSHGNFSLWTSGGPNPQIDAVELWNVPKEGSATVVWRSEKISVGDLEMILRAFVTEMVAIASTEAAAAVKGGK